MGDLEVVEADARSALWVAERDLSAAVGRTLPPGYRWTEAEAGEHVDLWRRWERARGDLRRSKNHLVAVRHCNTSFLEKIGERSRLSWPVPVTRCGVRLCAHEQRLRSARAQRRYAEKMAELDRSKLLTLAELSVGFDSLEQALDSLFAAWARLWRQLKKAESKGGYEAQGAVVALEITLNLDQPRGLCYHPHLHVLLDCPTYIPQQEIIELWIKATRGAGRTAQIQKADAGSSRELLKYVTKTSDFVGCPRAVGEFLRATHRKRFLRTYGSLYNFKPELEPTARNVGVVCLGCKKEFDSPFSLCPECGYGHTLICASKQGSFCRRCGERLRFGRSECADCEGRGRIAERLQCPYTDFVEFVLTGDGVYDDSEVFKDDEGLLRFTDSSPPPRASPVVSSVAEIGSPFAASCRDAKLRKFARFAECS